MQAIASRPWLAWLCAGALLAACGGSSTADSGTHDAGGTDVIGTDSRDVISSDRGTTNEAGNTDADVVIPPTDGPVREGGLPDVVDDRAMLDGGMCGGSLGTCDPVTSSGCNSGEACVLAGDGDGGVTTFCTAPGPGGYGDPCNTADGCLEGFACLGSVCRKLCCAIGDDAHCRTGTGGDPRGVCDVPLTGVPLAACELATACDWFAQDCPTAGDNCLPISADGTTQCSPAGSVAAGQPCGGSAGDCAVGSVCISDSTSPTGGKCLEICDPTLPDTADAGPTPDGGVSRHCPSGQTCFGFMASAMLPRNFGVCDTSP